MKVGSRVITTTTVKSVLNGRTVTITKNRLAQVSCLAPFAIIPQGIPYALSVPVESVKPTRRKS